MTAISVSERLLEMAAFYTPLALTVTSHLREEVVDMPITITLHIFGYTVTIRIKGENRHPGR